MKQLDRFVQIRDRPLTGKQIRAVRHALGMTQLEFAFYLKTGVPTVSAWENGHMQPRRMTEDAIKNLCIAHGFQMRDVA